MTETKIFVLTIDDNDFNKFDKGEQISQKIPKDCGIIKRGELIEWKFKRFSGRARVGLCFQVEGTMICHFTKVN